MAMWGKGPRRDLVSPEALAQVMTELFGDAWQQSLPRGAVMAEYPSRGPSIRAWRRGRRIGPRTAEDLEREARELKNPNWPPAPEIFPQHYDEGVFNTPRPLPALTERANIRNTLTAQGDDIYGTWDPRDFGAPEWGIPPPDIPAHRIKLGTDPHVASIVREIDRRRPKTPEEITAFKEREAAILKDLEEKRARWAREARAQRAREEILKQLEATETGEPGQASGEISVL